jgi:prepilin-type processing-associated H-X9-DG protein
LWRKRVSRRGAEDAEKRREQVGCGGMGGAVMSDDVVNDPEFADAIPKAKRSGWGFSPLGLLAVVGVIGLLAALMLPAIRRAPPGAMDHAECFKNLRQIALALQNYEAAHGAFPPAYTVDEKGRRLHSWRTLILPYLDRWKLYQRIDLSKPWDDPANAEAMRTAVSVYHCPGSDGAKNTTTYLAVVGEDACFRGKEPRRLEEITDDPALTLMVIETGEEAAVPWMAPVDADERKVMRMALEPDPHHERGANACFVDGSVDSLKSNMPVEVRRAIMSISGDDDEMARKW